VKRKELQELKHDPVPGYRTVFFLAISIAILYLAFIFFRG